MFLRAFPPPTALVVAAALGLTACATDDPAQGGFFGGLGGMASGNYQQRLDERQTTLENEQDRQVALNRQVERSQAQERELTQQRRSLQGELAALEREVGQLQSRLREARESRGPSPRLAELERNMDALQRSTRMVQSDDFASEQEKRRKLEELARRKAELERALNKALGG